jgi:hypothetical protein
MDFPPELLAAIFAYVSAPSDFENVRLVCHAWNAIIVGSSVMPHLVWPKHSQVPTLSKLVRLSDWFPQTTTIQIGVRLWAGGHSKPWESTATLLHEMSHRFPNLKNLSVLPLQLGSDRIGPSWIFSGPPYSPHLKLTNLQCPGQLLMSDACCLDVVTLFPNLTRLNCTSWSLDSGIVAFRELFKLRALGLQYTLVNDASLCRFAAGRTTQLTHLDLSMCRGVSDMGVYTVATSSPHLTHLCLDNMPNVHGGVTIMALATACMQLKSVYMRKEPGMLSTVTPPHLIYLAHRCLALTCVIMSGHPPSTSTPITRLLSDYYQNVFLW